MFFMFKKKKYYIFLLLFLLIFILIQYYRLSGSVCETINAKPKECFLDITKGNSSDNIVNSREFYACTYDRGSWSFGQRGMVFFFNKEGTLLYFSREFDAEYRPESFSNTDGFVVNDNILYLLPDLEFSLNPSTFRKIDAMIIQKTCKKNKSEH